MKGKCVTGSTPCKTLQHHHHYLISGLRQLITFEPSTLQLPHFNPSSVQPFDMRSTLQPFTPSIVHSTLQAFNPSTLPSFIQPFDPSLLRPFNPSTLQPFHTSTLEPVSNSTLPALTAWQQTRPLDQVKWQTVRSGTRLSCSDRARGYSQAD